MRHIFRSTILCMARQRRMTELGFIYRRRWIAHAVVTLTDHIRYASIGRRRLSGFCEGRGLASVMGTWRRGNSSPADEYHTRRTMDGVRTAGMAAKVPLVSFPYLTYSRLVSFQQDVCRISGSLLISPHMASSRASSQAAANTS